MTLAETLPRFFLQFDSRPARATRVDAAAPPEQRTMPRHAIATLDNRAQRLHVLRGCVWITRDGCPVDYVLNPGDVFEHDAGAPVLVQALEDTELLIAGRVASAQDA